MLQNQPAKVADSHLYAFQLLRTAQRKLHTAMPPAKLSAASPAFMLLGGVSSLPSGTLVRGLLNRPKATPPRVRDIEAEWDYFQLRTYGVGIPERASKMKRRSEASDRA